MSIHIPLSICFDLPLFNSVLDVKEIKYLKVLPKAFKQKTVDCIYLKSFKMKP